MTTPLVVSTDIVAAADSVADDAVRVLKATAVDGSGSVVAESLAGFDDPASNITGVEKLVKAIVVSIVNSYGPSAEEDWITASLINGWAHTEPLYAPVQYRKDRSGTVFVRGLTSGGVLLSPGDDSGIVFTLPSEHQPQTEMAFSTPCLASEVNGLTAQVRVGSDGSVRVYSAFTAAGAFGVGTGEWVSLTLCFKLG
jgi:hypothetical protein